MELLKIVPAGTKVTPLTFTDEQLERINDIKSKFSNMKRNPIREVTGYGDCVICSGLPAYMIEYSIPGGGGSRLEYVCNSCASSKVFEKIQNESLEEIADSYNCTKVAFIPATKSEI